MEKIVILDFGGQTTQLIARRLREEGIYCEIVQGNDDTFLIQKTEVKGIILSGSPYSVYESNSPKPSNSIFKSGVPILGICYGLQILTDRYNGTVKRSDHQEFGRAKVFFTKRSPLFKNVPDGFFSWMSHGDSILELGKDFELLAQSENHPAAVSNEKLQFFGIQFHPEISHCDYGTEILKNFAVEICGVSPSWTMSHYLETSINEIRNIAGNNSVLLLISGGVDSTVVAALLLQALPPERVHLMYIDTGLMRKGETEEVKRTIYSLGGRNIQIIDATERFLKKLKGVSDPEEKRRIIGDLFIQVQEEEISGKIPDNYFLAQGTLYTDMIESGKGVGTSAKVIKSHHNVRSPLVDKKRKEGKILEPLSFLFKDEVRSLGLLLHVPPQIINRHPFPGPGLGVRIVGEVTSTKCEILREADYIFIEELKKRKLYDDIWQAFCVLLPVKSVGVTGDSRKYGYVLTLRAVNSVDGMSADVYPFKINDILEISSRITNSVPEIGRIVYDISSKPPATIEWE